MYQLLTVKQAAKALSIHPETVREWLREGKIKGVKLGATKLGWRIPEEELDRFLHDRMTEQHGEV